MQSLLKPFFHCIFRFFRLSNLAPHAISEFDPSRHFTVADLFFEKKQVTLLLKWSKTIQTRDSKINHSSPFKVTPHLPLAGP